MSLTEVEPLERVRRVVETVPELAGARIAPLVGDASNRAYFRIAPPGGGSRIVALVPEPFDPGELPFLNVLKLFAKIPIRVPEVVCVFGDAGALVLEDLGDAMLQDVVETSAASVKAELYRCAIDILGKLAVRGAELRSERYTPYRVRFDIAKFMWELDFFRKHFLEGLRARVLEASELDVLDSAFRELSGELCSHPFVLCHRDYHSRNLMLVKGQARELGVIDFQDARQGPRAYDLVSLLNDSYVSHEPEFVKDMTARFEAAVGADLADEYDVAALQRNLKALGTFGYQISQLGNEVYRRYVDATVRMVGENLARNARWDSLRRILARHCEEIG